MAAEAGEGGVQEVVVGISDQAIFQICRNFIFILMFEMSEIASECSRRQIGDLLYQLYITIVSFRPKSSVATVM